MIRLLTKLFIKDRENTGSPGVRRAYGTLVSVVCIILNILLCAFKFLAGTLSGSIAIRADAMNNLSDAGSSLITLISFKLAAKPADRDHPFGHARIEYVASMVVAFLILFVGVELVKGSLEKLIAPVAPVFHLLTVCILAVSVLCKLWIAFFNRTVGKKIDSEVMRATATDSLSDAGATAAVLLANLSTLFLPESVSKYVDPVMGVLVSLLIFWAGLQVLNETKNLILGEAPTRETVEAIRAVVSEYPDAIGIHDLTVHQYGPGRTLASLHIEVDGKRDIFETHDTIDLIERRLFEELGIECTVHMDPIVTDDESLNHLRERVREIVSGMDGRIQIHDFRMVPGLTHTNLIFDIAVPFEVTTPDKELTAAIAAAVNAADPTHFAVITVDRV